LFEPEGCVRLAKAGMFEIIKITEEWDKKFPKDEIMATYESCAEGADVIIAANLTMSPSYCMAEKLNLPWIPVVLGATLPTSEFPLWALESIALFSCLNKWTYNLVFKMLWQSESKYINPWRTNSLGLPALTCPRGIADIIDALQPPIIIATSVKTIGKNSEIPHDYPANVYVPGFFYVPRTPEDSIDPALRHFLEDHRKDHRVIYLGFGSMPLGDPLHFVRMTLEICSSMLCRAVVVAGWSKLLLEDASCQALLSAAMDDQQVFVASAVPHDYLFPRVDAIVHHCGVGTMAAALRAGKPQIPCPVMLDQPHNARIVQRLGCALDYIPFQQLTSSNLSRALERIFCNEGGIFEQAQLVQQEIEEECGGAMEEAQELIVDYVKRFRMKQDPH
jgi:sterol 3beta-glucosyltransferase